MRALILVLLLLVPIASAQDTVPGTYPPDADVPDADESVEEGPGVIYGTVLIIGVLAFAGALAWVGWRQARRPPSMP